MDAPVTAMLVILGGFAVIYVIATKLGNQDDTESKDSKSGNSKDSVRVLSRGQYKEYVTEHIICGDGDTVVIKGNIWLSIFVSVCFFIMAPLLAPVLVEMKKPQIMALFPVVIGLVILYYCNSKTILYNEGIIVRTAGHAMLIPWKAISEVTYKGPFEFSYSFILHSFYYRRMPGFSFHFILPREARPLYKKTFININHAHAGYKKCLEYAVKKLSKHKFDIFAQEKLEKMGIGFLR
jgi:hypothetical protein